MNIEIIKDEKNDVEMKMDNLTVAEIMRVYLHEDGIDFAAWRREHPARPIIMRIQSSGKSVKKAVGYSVEHIRKDLDKIKGIVKKK